MSAYVKYVLESRTGVFVSELDWLLCGFQSVNTYATFTAPTRPHKCALYRTTRVSRRFLSSECLFSFIIRYFAEMFENISLHNACSANVCIIAY